MSEQDQATWAVQALQKLQTTDNAATITGIISVIEAQQTEIESLRGSMEGQLWSPTSWQRDREQTTKPTN